MDHHNESVVKTYKGLVIKKYEAPQKPKLWNRVVDFFTLGRFATILLSIIAVLILFS